MLSYSKAFYELVDKLQPIYDKGEATAMAHEVLFHITGQDKLQRITNKDVEFTFAQQQDYATMLAALLIGKPLQYVTGKAWFMGKEYIVNEHVLIPRPETEELVDWIISEFGIGNLELGIMDIGSGTGCIPISLKLAMPDANVSSCDISEVATAVAKQNATTLQADVNFMQLDFLDESNWAQLGKYDIIVSNPPYIPVTEKNTLHQNVRDFEPGLALFVPDNDPLVFYKAIAAFGATHLANDGAIYCEVHADYGIQTKEMFETAGYDTELRKDMHGNWRMIKARAKNKG